MLEWPASYLDWRRKENEEKNHRRLMWLSKFAFPEVNTKSTKVLIAMPGTRSYRFPVVEPLQMKAYSIDEIPEMVNAPKVDEVKLERWAHKGKRWCAGATFAYYERLDVLIVVEGSFWRKTRYELDYYA